MNKGSIQELVESMDPLAAATEMADAAKKLFSLLGEEALRDFLARLIGDEDRDKITGLVHLGLATCMDEGVDPRTMCRSLVEKVSQSEQLRSVADPEILVLFEDWLEELENETITIIKRRGSLSPADLSAELGLSESGSLFLISKLKREGKV